MSDETPAESRTISDVIKEDARKTTEEFSTKLRAQWNRPVYLVFVVVGAVVALAANHLMRRALNAVLDEPQVVQLDSELQAVSAELKESADEIKSVVDDLGRRATSDPTLKKEFDGLQARLVGLMTLVEKTSAQTEKVAVISEALREDWERNQQVVDRKTNSVPDLVLGSGDAAGVCNGLATVGVIATDSSDGTVQIKVKDWTYRVKPAQQVPLAGGATVDFIGLEGDNAQLQISCP